MDDYIGTAIYFEVIFSFLYHYYFFYTSFGLIYLAFHKTFVFIDQLDFVNFIRNKNRLQPLIKHRNRIQHWLVSIA